MTGSQPRTGGRETPIPVQIAAGSDESEKMVSEEDGKLTAKEDLMVSVEKTAANVAHSASSTSRFELNGTIRKLRVRRRGKREGNSKRCSEEVTTACRAPFYDCPAVQVPLFGAAAAAASCTPQRRNEAVSDATDWKSAH